MLGLLAVSRQNLSESFHIRYALKATKEPLRKRFWYIDLNLPNATLLTVISQCHPLEAVEPVSCGVGVVLLCGCFGLLCCGVGSAGFGQSFGRRARMQTARPASMLSHQG